jgi:hypothetical protein
MQTRTINDAKNPRYSDPDHTGINLEVDFDELDEVYVDFTAVPADIYPWGVELYNRALSGEFGPVADYAPSPLSGDNAWAKLRANRILDLEATDYVEMPTRWSQLSEADQVAWTTYRNALRDLPQNVTDPVYSYSKETKSWGWNFAWPVKPE